jgi:hypothetical protein
VVELAPMKSASLPFLLVLLSKSPQSHAEFLRSIVPHMHSALGEEPSSFVEAALGSDPHHSDHTHDDHGHAKEVHHEDAHHASSVQHSLSSHSSADSVAVGLMAWIILNPVVIYMTLTKAAGGQISFLTLRMVDISISIFLAVLWFSASSEVLKSDALHNFFPHAEEVFAVLQVLVLYILTMVVANSFRDNKYYLLAFCGCAGHYVAFAAIKAVGDGQQTAGSFVGHGASPYMSLLFCFVVLGILAMVSFVCFYSWRRYVDAKSELHFAIDELELDIIGLVLSFAIMQSVRHMLSGHYPEAHMLLQMPQAPMTLSADSDSGHGHSHHTAAQRNKMLACAVGFTICSGLSLKFFEAVKERTHYWMHKALHIVQVVLVMCAAWGYLLWGQWQFYESTFDGDLMFGNMIFAVVITVISILIILVLAFADNQFASVKAYGNLCIMAVSLMTAWSWEHCFHVAIEVIATQHEAAWGTIVPKLTIAILIPVIILPGYLTLIKPVVVEKEEVLMADEIAEFSADISEVTAETASPGQIKSKGEEAW